MIFCVNVGAINTDDLLILQEEHENMTKMKGDNQPLEWIDYKSMTFTQCVMISMPPYFLKLICISYIPPHLLTTTSKLTGIFHIIIRNATFAGDK